MNKQRIILAGGSGFLGRALAPVLLDRGYEPVILTRTPQSGSSVPQVYWDGRTRGEWTRLLDGAGAVVNLAGKNVNCRYTPENRREIVKSRIDSVRAVAAAIRGSAQPPKVWVQAGSLAIYGDAREHWCDETTPAGDGFPAETCVLWEREFNATAVPGTRRVLLRIGFALGANDGVLAVLSRLTRWFLGGTIGSGRQYISWVHIEDLTRMFLRALEEGEGVFNATGPNPVTNAEFMSELRLALRRPWSPPVPPWAVRIGSRLMRTEACLALTGRRCTPGHFPKFEFRFPRLAAALDDLLRQPKGGI